MTLKDYFLKFKNLQKVKNELRKLSFIATGYSSPNPPVGCVITDEKGKILSTGFTLKPGNDHAEICAYKKFTKKQPHHLFVTLEPCTHFGKTPPCADTILKQRPKSLFYGLKDPNPLVKKNRYATKYKNSSIRVVQDEDLAEIAESFLNGFFSITKKKRPSVLIKTVVSGEGYFFAKGQRVRLSGVESDYLTQILRSKFDAILVGPNTIQVDDPSLDFRPVKFCKSDFKIWHSKNIFFSELFVQSQNLKTVAFHNRNFSDFQPIRVFVLNSEDNISELFYKKQQSINKKTKCKKTIFFLIQKKFEEKKYSKKFIEKLQDLSDYSIFQIQETEIPEKIFRILKKQGVNTLLVEGGNFMYERFGSVLTKYDSILKIKAKKSIRSGVLPKLKFDENCLNFKAQVGEDQWEVYNPCLQELSSA